eukprot:scaffold2849_cov174-Amphora_coffeaeformis.AAC.19
MYALWKLHPATVGANEDVEQGIFVNGELSMIELYQRTCVIAAKDDEAKTCGADDWDESTIVNRQRHTVYESMNPTRKIKTSP